MQGEFAQNLSRDETLDRAETRVRLNRFEYK